MVGAVLTSLAASSVKVCFLSQSPRTIRSSLFSGHSYCSNLGHATPLRRLGESCAHELRNHDRDVELPEQRFEGDQYGGGRLDWHYYTRTDARQRGETDVTSAYIDSDGQTCL